MDDLIKRAHQGTRRLQEPGAGRARGAAARRPAEHGARGLRAVRAPTSRAPTSCSRRRRRRARSARSRAASARCSAAAAAAGRWAGLAASFTELGVDLDTAKKFGPIVIDYVRAPRRRRPRRARCKRRAEALNRRPCPWLRLESRRSQSRGSLHRCAVLLVALRRRGRLRIAQPRAAARQLPRGPRTAGWRTAVRPGRCAGRKRLRADPGERRGARARHGGRPWRRASLTATHAGPREHADRAQSAASELRRRGVAAARWRRAAGAAVRAPSCGQAWRFFAQRR
ncbi:MAG: hypothetical protein MZV70_34020 [Desulfobacterales bacterium]|nr:hypothetical protein [Desulfobacterales bacterium]